MEFPQTQRNRLRRIPQRGHYDKATVDEVLDAGFLCHVGFEVDQQPFVIPTLYGRDDDRLYLHGSAASRMLCTLAHGIQACLSVTHVDGLVLARPAFHHSMNYRGAGNLQTRTSLNHDWTSHQLVSDHDAPLARRWVSIPPNVWHQAVVPASNWVVVSFHTAAPEELIEERPVESDAAATCRRHYVESD